MDNKAQLAEKLKAANNVLVTVSNSPSVDQLAACIGMTIWLNKLGKHATAVFSGDVPNTLEFLEPEETLEKNTDSLRDFIIALDKSKADKLRYKVEDRVVKIFITPYRTSLSADDLEFSQGDFNVDAIIAIGVTKQEDLDQAIVSHGRILHDATVATINTTDSGDIGSINWRDTTASSLCELVYDLCQVVDAKQIDPQIATALLTGIVAETNRFSNDRTSPNTMSAAAALMGAGANQQLVANKLAETLSSNKSKPAKTDDGTLQIGHSEETKEEVAPLPVPKEESKPEPAEPTPSKMIIEPPTLGGQLTANSLPQDTLEPTTDPLSLPPVDTAQLLNREPLTPITSEPQPEDIPKTQPLPGPGVDSQPSTENVEDKDDQTLSEIEQAVDSPHLKEIRDQISQVVDATGTTQTGTEPDT
ncbi:MAG: hypothetical protein ACREF7_03870, partial [Candidatus Saccharimonadales bacterium]